MTAFRATPAQVLCPVMFRVYLWFPVGLSFLRGHGRGLSASRERTELGASLLAPLRLDAPSKCFKATPQAARLKQALGAKTNIVKIESISYFMTHSYMISDEHL